MELLAEAFLRAVNLIVSGDPELLRIAGLSVLVSGAATCFAALVGLPLGAALHLGRFRGHRLTTITINTGTALPPVLVGLVITLLLWRSGPFGSLRLLFTPQAMVLAQFIVAMPIAASFTRAALGLLDSEITAALRADGAGERRVAWELACAAQVQVLVAIAAAFGRAVAEVGASLMVGGNIVGQTRILTTAIALEAGRGEFALALALGLILLALAFLVNLALGWGERAGP